MNIFNAKLIELKSSGAVVARRSYMGIITDMIIAMRMSWVRPPPGLRVLFCHFAPELLTVDSIFVLKVIWLRKVIMQRGVSLCSALPT